MATENEHRSTTLLLEHEGDVITTINFVWEKDASNGAIKKVIGWNADKLREYFHSRKKSIKTSIRGWVNGPAPYDYLWVCCMASELLDFPHLPFDCLRVENPPAPLDYMPSLRRNLARGHGVFEPFHRQASQSKPKPDPQLFP